MGIVQGGEPIHYQNITFEVLCGLCAEGVLIQGQQKWDIYRVQRTHLTIVATIYCREFIAVALPVYTLLSMLLRLVSAADILNVPKGSQGLELCIYPFVAAACLSAKRTCSSSAPKSSFASVSDAVVALSAYICSGRACAIECWKSSAVVLAAVSIAAFSIAS